MQLLRVEPFPVQEPQNNAETPIFKSYDLVKGKPAGVLIQIQYQFPKDCLQNANSNKCIKQRDFNLQVRGEKSACRNKMCPYETDRKRGLAVSSFLPNHPIKPVLLLLGDFSLKDPVIYKFVELDTSQMESVELEKIYRSK